MNQRHLAGLAAFLVGAVGGGTVLGDDDDVGVDCSIYSPQCQTRCAELQLCLATSPASSDCRTEESRLASCARRWPPSRPPPVIVVPPPACPAGRHLHESGCHADHVCGDDEMGGGGEDCKPCGEGEVPNEDRTACVACDWGEETPGVCNPEPCQRLDADAAANSALSGIKKEAQERGQIIYCENGEVRHGAWAFSGSNKCRAYPNSPHGRSCLAGGSKRTGCNLTGIHSHPYFIYDRDMNLTCNGTRISSPAVADRLNRINMVFSSLDIATLTARQTDGHLLVSDRSAILPWRYLAVFPIPWAASMEAAEASNDD